MSIIKDKFLIWFVQIKKQKYLKAARKRRVITKWKNQEKKRLATLSDLEFYTESFHVLNTCPRRSWYMLGSNDEPQ